MLIIISLAAFFPYIYSQLFVEPRPSVLIDKNMLSEVELIKTSVKNERRFVKNKNDSTHIPSPFLFNPNNTSDKEWLKLGLKEFQVKIISNYTTKGGVFKTKGDLLKIYSIKPDWYSSIKNYILLPDTIVKETKTTQNKVFKPYEAVLDINTIDSSSLEKLPGIGAYLAGKIIRYRNSLGGFYSKNQILEINGMREELFKKFENKLNVLSPIKHINVNTCSAEELTSHPYLKKKLGKVIYQFVKQRGKINNTDELKSIPILADSTLSKIKPYLRF